MLLMAGSKVQRRGMSIGRRSDMLTTKQLQENIRVFKEAKDIKVHRRPRWEYVVVAVVLVVVGVSIAVTYDQQVKHFRQVMVRQQLWQIRNAVLMYNTLYRNIPPDLVTLARTTVKDPRSSIDFPLLENVRVEGNKVFDPLGYEFDYNSIVGTVSSRAPCCTLW